MFTKRKTETTSPAETAAAPPPDPELVDTAATTAIQNDEDVGRRALESVMTARGLNQRSNLLTQVSPVSRGAGEECGGMAIGEQVHVTGEIKDFANLEILGSFSGDLSGTNLVVGCGGVVNGNIRVDTLTVLGRLQGESQVSGHVVIKSTGCLEGQLNYGSIEVENGCEIRGQLLSFTESGSQTSTDNEDHAPFLSSHEPLSDVAAEDVGADAVFQNLS